MGNPKFMLLTLSFTNQDEKYEKIEARHVCPSKVDLLCDSLLKRPKMKFNSKKVTKKAPKVDQSLERPKRVILCTKIRTSKKKAAISPGTPEAFNSASVKKTSLASPEVTIKNSNDKPEASASIHNVEIKKISDVSLPVTYALISSNTSSSEKEAIPIQQEVRTTRLKYDRTRTDACSNDSPFEW